jgi:hypothetical protein
MSENYSEYSVKKIINNIVVGDVVGTITANGMQSFNHDNCWLVIEERNGVEKETKKDF